MTKNIDVLEPVFLSEEKLHEIKKDLDDIEKIVLPEIRNRLSIAYEDGDLRENNPWETANNDLQETFKKRNTLRELLLRYKKYQKMHEKEGYKTKVGRTFTVQLNNSAPITIKLVASEEADPVNGLLSCESPIGKGILSAKKGKTNQISTPSGIIELLLIK